MSRRDALTPGRRAVLLACAALVCAAAPARADIGVVEGSFGSGAQPSGAFVDATGIASDSAGRVYVADAGAKHVEVFDSVSGANAFLRTIGDGTLERPVAVAIDNRSRLYVADAARHVVEVYAPFFDGFTHLATLGAPGTAIGQLDTPTAMVTDRTQRLYVAENGNLRISVWRYARGTRKPARSAFGVSQPDPFGSLGGIARDRQGRLYLSGASAGAGALRVYTPTGRMLGDVAPSAALASPAGMDTDAYGRLVVADRSAGRLAVFSVGGASISGVDSVNGLTQPLGVAFAPGARLYVLGSTSVVRLRFDDPDLDGVATPADNCPGVANPDQDDADDDGRGDACESSTAQVSRTGDRDGDGKSDADDRCPDENAAPDENSDGCSDPTSALRTPGDGRSYGSLGRITGTAEGGRLGLKRVEVAVARRLDSRAATSSRAQCAWLTPRKRAFTPGPCTAPVWFTAEGTDRWKVALPPGLLTSGPYLVRSRAKQRRGLSEKLVTEGRNLRLFRLSGT